MKERSYSLLALLAVVGVSVVFGVIVGGRLNAPPTALAAPAPGALDLAPAATFGAGVPHFADIVDRALPAVVSVTATQSSNGQDGGEREFFHWWFMPEPEEMEPSPGPREPRIGEGSGFVIAPDGYVLTNNHVVEDSDNVKVRMQDGREYRAEVVGTDPSIDLALLKIDAGRPLPTLPLGDSSAIRVGEWVIAIGNPLEFEQTVTVGVVSGKGRRVPIGATDLGVVSFIQTDAAINFGNSGGPLLDSAGNVIGINTAIRRTNFAEGIGFALPINHAIAVMDQLRDRGFVRRGYIGITMNEAGIDEVAREYYRLPDRNGVIIDQVQPDGPAQRAGLRQGDIIRRVDGETIEDNLDLISTIAGHQPGERVQLEIFRSGKSVQVTATLSDRGEELQTRLNPRGGRPSEPEREPEVQESTGLGLTVENVSTRLRRSLALEEDQEGVVVTEVSFDAEAFRKGVRPDMLVLAVNDRRTPSVADWTRALADLEPGAPVKLTVLVPVPEEQGEDRTFFVYLRTPAG